MLNEHQKKFCEYYVACGNAAEDRRLQNSNKPF